MTRTKIRRQFEIAESPGEMQSGTHFAFEAGQWKAKYETIKEVLDYERKKRKEVETNLNKLAYELGGVKNEVRQLEEKIRLLTGKPEEKPVEKKAEKPLEAKVPELRYQPAPVAEIPKEPFAGTSESPRLYIKFADAKQEIAAAPAAKDEPCSEISEQKQKPQPEPRDLPQEDEEVGDVMTSLETSFKAETAETWGYATALLNALKNTPADLQHEKINDHEAREGIYYGFVDKFKKLNADYYNYRELVPVIDSDLKNLDKVIPYTDYYLAELYHEA